VQRMSLQPEPPVCGVNSSYQQQHSHLLLQQQQQQQQKQQEYQTRLEEERLCCRYQVSSQMGLSGAEAVYPYQQRPIRIPSPDNPHAKAAVFAEHYVVSHSPCRIGSNSNFPLYQQPPQQPPQPQPASQDSTHPQPWSHVVFQQFHQQQHHQLQHQSTLQLQSSDGALRLVLPCEVDHVTGESVPSPLDLCGGGLKNGPALERSRSSSHYEQQLRVAQQEAVQADQARSLHVHQQHQQLLRQHAQMDGGCTAYSNAACSVSRTGNAPLYEQVITSHRGQQQQQQRPVSLERETVRDSYDETLSDTTCCSTRTCSPVPVSGLVQIGRSNSSTTVSLAGGLTYGLNQQPYQQMYRQYPQLQANSQKLQQQFVQPNVKPSVNVPALLLQQQQQQQCLTPKQSFEVVSARSNRAMSVQTDCSGGTDYYSSTPKPVGSLISTHIPSYQLPDDASCVDGANGTAVYYGSTLNGQTLHNMPTDNCSDVSMIARSHFHRDPYQDRDTNASGSGVFSHATNSFGGGSVSKQQYLLHGNTVVDRQHLAHGEEELSNHRRQENLLLEHKQERDALEWQQQQERQQAEYMQQHFQFDLLQSSVGGVW
jgi:hypothetical protein